MYEVLRDCRDYGLRDQMTRAAVSMASNIAEGAERASVPAYNRLPKAPLLSYALSATLPNASA